MYFESDKRAYYQPGNITNQITSWSKPNSDASSYTS